MYCICIAYDVCNYVCIAYVLHMMYLIMYVLHMMYVFAYVCVNAFLSFLVIPFLSCCSYN